MSAAKKRRPVVQPVDTFADELWQLVALLSALKHQLRAIEDGGVEDSDLEVHNGQRVCCEVGARLAGLAQILGEGIDMRVTHDRAKQLLEALR